MDKFKYQIIAIALAMLAGGFIGAFTVTKDKEIALEKLTKKYEQSIKQYIETSENKIQQLNNSLIKLQASTKKDSLLILNLNYRLKQDGVRVDQLRKQATKLNNNEKEQWLVNWYYSLK